MKKAILALLITCLCALSAAGQESGNSGVYRRGDNGRRTPPNGGVLSGERVQYIEAYVLLNVVPDEFVAVFGAAQVASTAIESNQKVNAQIEQFLNAAEKVGVNRGNTFVDFITQNRVYSYGSPASDGTIREQLSGFETKKTISLRYKNRPVLEKLLDAAAQASIFDLIKVDYVVNDMTKIHNRLFEEASRVIKQKEDSYTHSLGLTMKRFALLQETYNTFHPAELYQTYTAFESGAVDNYYGNARIIRERKSSTSYLEPLDVSAFDSVLTPEGIEPMVQCTLYMKVSYNLAS